VIFGAAENHPECNRRVTLRAKTGRKTSFCLRATKRGISLCDRAGPYLWIIKNKSLMTLYNDRVRVSFGVERGTKDGIFKGKKLDTVIPFCY